MGRVDLRKSEVAFFEFRDADSRLCYQKIGEGNELIFTIAINFLCVPH